MNEPSEMYEIPESRRRRVAREAAAVRHPYASQAERERLRALVENQRGEIAELRTWRAGLETYLGEFFSGTDGRLLTLEATLRENGLERPKRGAENLADRLRALEGRADLDDTTAAERRERS